VPYTKNNGQIHSFRPLFKDSFYNLDNDTLKPSREVETRTIFFASAGMGPIRIEWLERKKQEFNNKIRDLYPKFEELVSEKNKKDAIDNFNDSINKQQNKFDDNLKDAQKGNITTLGIFAGLITFITSSVAFFRFNTEMHIMLPTSIKYFAIFTAILILGLGMFALFLKILFLNTRDKSWVKYLLFILVLLIASFLLYIFFYHKISIIEKELPKNDQAVEKRDVKLNISLDASVVQTKDSTNTLSVTQQ
jgi:hypothetical protein